MTVSITFRKQFTACTGLLLTLIITTGCAGRSKSKTAAIPPNSAPLQSLSVAFEDASEKSGINFTHVNGASGKKYFPEIMGAGCAFIDYNRDGKPDIFLVNGAPMPGFKGNGKPTAHLFRNKGNGEFTDVTTGSGLDLTYYGMGCSVGDFDNDGYDDLYVTAVLGPGHLFHNNRNGTFTDVTAKAGVGDRGDWGTSCAWLDYDRDGKLDLFICNYVVYRSLKDNIPCSFRPGTISYCTPRVYKGSACVLYHNLGNGRFEDVTKKAGVYNELGKSLGVSVWDYNDDGLPDIFVANDGAPNLLFRNNGNGTFSDVGSEAGIAYGEAGETRAGMGIDVCDELGNGKSTMVVTNFSAEMVGLYRQTGSELFQDDAINSGVGPATMLTLGFGVSFLDADNDGINDIGLVNGHVQDDIALIQTSREFEQHPMLFIGDGHGGYSEVGSKIGGPFAKKYVGRGLALGDYDGDGRTDILMTENNGRAHLWRNVSSNANHWISFRLRGAKSNASGIGAKVTINSGDKSLSTVVRSGSSYLSASDLVAHFGLGSASLVKSVEIKWPSGKVQRMNDIPADRAVVVTEK
jgi:hypothetical protein